MKKNTVIIGSGECGSTTASILSKQGNNIYIVDKNEKEFENLDKSYSGFFIEKEITDDISLKNIIDEKIDVLVIVTGDDNVNIFLSLIAKNVLKIETVITRLYDEEKNFLLDNEIEIFYPSLLAIDKIKSYL